MLLWTRTNAQDQLAQTESSVEKPVRRGTTMMEYLMMLSLIFVACLIAIGYLGGTNNSSMSTSSGSINKAMKKGN